MRMDDIENPMVVDALWRNSNNHDHLMEEAEDMELTFEEEEYLHICEDAVIMANTDAEYIRLMELQQKLDITACAHCKGEGGLNFGSGYVSCPKCDGLGETGHSEALKKALSEI